MAIESKNTALRYQGYLHTPLLWNNKKVLGLEQLNLPAQLSPDLDFDDNISGPLLLGKLVERFVEIELLTYKEIQILLKNAQIQKGKTTIGELDCILKQYSNSIHLEIIYKFYLYDPTAGSIEIEHWIGPNRKDTLLKKLNKLKDKQLPLINSIHTRPLLEKYNLKVNDILQRVYFKAQLFVPYDQEVKFEILNDKCLNGFYIHDSELKRFKNCNFYIPNKVDWLIEVHNQVHWLCFDQFQEKIEQFINNNRAPLCWIKYPHGKLQKFFVVWWK